MRTLLSTAIAALLAAATADGITPPVVVDGATTQPAIEKPTQVAIEVLKSPKDEADSNPFVVRVYRPLGTHERLRVAIITGGQMTPGEDYIAPPGIIEIPADQPFLDLNIYLIDDDEAEGEESIEISAFVLPSMPTTRPAGKKTQ